MAQGTFTRALLGSLDRVAALMRKASQEPAHLDVGRAGEEIAYFHLRKCGYTIVARNWRNPRRKGELDLVGWDGGVLCFVEVKTRTRKTFVPAEAAVHREKMHEIASMARLFLRQHPPGTPFRFDVVSVYLVPGQDSEVELFKDAFGWRVRRS